MDLGVGWYEPGEGISAIGLEEEAIVAVVLQCFRPVLEFLYCSGAVVELLRAGFFSCQLFFFCRCGVRSSGQR